MKVLLAILIFSAGVFSIQPASAAQQFAGCFCKTSQDTGGSCYVYGCDWRIYLTGVYFDSNGDFQQVEIARTESGQGNPIPRPGKTQCNAQLKALVEQGICPANSSTPR